MSGEFEKPKCKYEVLDHIIKTDCTVKRKISGTSLGAVIGKSQYATPFKVACELMGLADRDISGEDPVHTGVVLESKIIDYHNTVHNDVGEFIPAKDVFGENVGKHEDWKDNFEHPVFGGHVDGFVSINGEDYILECKTVNRKKVREWKEHVPEHYFWQVALYNHFLTQKDRAFFVVGIVDETTYADPHGWIPTEKNCLLFEVEINQQEVAEKVAEAEEWYKTYILNGVTPMWSEMDKHDMELVNHLIAVNIPTVSLELMLDRLMDLEEQIDIHDAEIQDKRVEAKELRDSIRDAMITNGKTELTSSTGRYFGTLTESKRAKWDESLMKKDGVDIAKYKSETTTYTFKPKQVK